jgi:hypothetical protein
MKSGSASAYLTWLSISRCPCSQAGLRKIYEMLKHYLATRDVSPPYAFTVKQAWS